MLTFLKRLFNSNTPSLQTILQNGAVVIDVRTPQEYKQGHVKGSKNIPLNDIKSKTDMIRSWSKPVITVCRSGSRSQLAKSILKANNIEVYNGGGWTSFKNKYNL